MNPSFPFYPAATECHALPEALQARKEEGKAQRRGPVPWWLAVSAQYSGGRTPGNGSVNTLQTTFAFYFSPLTQKSGINCGVMVNEAILRCWGQTRCCAVMFVTLGQRRGDRRVEVGEDGVSSTCSPLRLQWSGGSAPSSAQRLSLGSAAPPGGCLQTAFYKGINAYQ